MKELANNNWTTGNTSVDIVIGLMLIISVMVLCVAILMLKVVKVYVAEAANPKPFATTEEREQKRLDQEALMELKRKQPTIWTKIMQLKPIEEEGNLVMDHKYDGIAELDNPIPLWFKGLFYVSIIFGIGYLLNYHVFHYGLSQTEEYTAEIQQAANDKIAFLSNSVNAASAINENNIVQSKDAVVIKNGQGLFATRCTPCHGDNAQGLVGPNLTDEYWLHGGTIKDIFKTIKYGVPEKGMISWEKSMSAQQISDIADYVMSLQGSKPAGAKAPQGTK